MMFRAFLRRSTARKATHPAGMVSLVKPIAIGFDFDHTLAVDNKLERAAFLRLMQGMSTSEGRTLDLDRAGAAMDREIALYRAGRYSLEAAFTRAVESALGELPKTSALESFRELAVSMVPEHVKALPGVSELLQRLNASSTPYALLTNGWNPLQQCKADSIGFSKPVFVSDDLGVRKPNVRAFEVLRDYFDLAPERIWYIGDDPLIDIVGALGAGMRAIWFDWEHKKYPTDKPAPTAIIRNITDALSIVMS